MRAVRLLREALTLPDVTDVIDCATGQGKHAQAFLSQDKHVVGIDLGRSFLRHSNYRHLKQSFEKVSPEPADLVWSCHTLEHVPNPGLMLTKFREWLKPDGWLAIAVPTNQQDRIHIGHLSLWTPAHLMYNLVVNGWDCSGARWYTEYCTIAVLLQKTDDIDFRGSTAMPTEKDWLNKYMPRKIIHEGDSWWPNNWHKETGDRVENPPYVNVGLNKPYRPA